MMEGGCEGAVLLGHPCSKTLLMPSGGSPLWLPRSPVIPTTWILLLESSRVPSTLLFAEAAVDVAGNPPPGRTGNGVTLSSSLAQLFAASGGESAGVTSWADGS